MRVVIADDEKYVLVVLKSTLSKLRYPIEIVGEAMDGEEAFRLCRERQPELLITDICMPRTDGLDMLALLREELPELPVIIYSGFDSFSYAQRAIHYGIEEYLLKPIDGEKLERAIGSIIERRQQARSRERAEAANRLLHALVLHALTPDAPFLTADPAAERFMQEARGCTLHMLRLTGLAPVQQHAWLRCFAELDAYCWEIDEAAGRVVVLTAPAADGPLIAAADDIWGADAYLAARQSISELCAREAAGTERQLRALCAELGRMQRQMERRFRPSASGADSGQPDSAAAERFNRGYADRAAAAVQLGKKEYLQSLLTEYWTQLLETWPDGSPEQLKRAAWSLTARQARQLGLPVERTEAYEQAHAALLRPLTADEFLQRLLALGAELITAQRANGGRADDGLREVIEHYLQENYRADSTLEQLAAYLHFNPSYTSDLFKRIFGRPFVAYLTAMRIDAAKVLLDSGRFKAYEIAAQVGYQDEKYFLKTFKKVAGCTPKEYRKRKQKGGTP